MLPSPSFISTAPYPQLHAVGRARGSIRDHGPAGSARCSARSASKTETVRSLTSTHQKALRVDDRHHHLYGLGCKQDAGRHKDIPPPEGTMTGLI